jgi:two-component system OmpR family response regulator
MRILSVEDDKDILKYICKGLEQAGHTVDAADNGRDGLFLATTEQYDVIVVDRMMPQLDGITLIKTLRGAGNQTPVLILSALADVDDKVVGLRSGGDDYLTKPFAFAELQARIEVLAKRGQPSASDSEHYLRAGSLEVDLLARTVKRDGQTIELQAREFKLLVYLMRHKGQVVTRTMLLEHVWDYHFDPQTNVIDVHISRLRSKLDKGFDTPLIRTVRGAGYAISDS